MIDNSELKHHFFCSVVLFLSPEYGVGKFGNLKMLEMK